MCFPLEGTTPQGTENRTNRMYDPKTVCPQRVIANAVDVMSALTLVAGDCTTYPRVTACINAMVKLSRELPTAIDPDYNYSTWASPLPYVVNAAVTIPCGAVFQEALQILMLIDLEVSDSEELHDAADMAHEDMTDLARALPLFIYVGNMIPTSADLYRG